MVETLKPDLCVIGAGAGGLTVAAAARAVGASVVLVERDAMGGGNLNTGSVPSKALIAAARRAHIMRNSAAFGVTGDEPRVNFGRINAHIRGVIAEIAPHQSVERFEALGARVIRAHARFVDKRTLAAGDVHIRARRFVIATGSRPAIPDIPGLADIDYLTSETVFDLTRRPGHIIVIGGGPMGLELAQAYLRLGCQVSVVEMRTPLGREDPELAEIVLRRLRAEGVAIHTDTGIVAVERVGNAIQVALKHGPEETTLTGSHLLVAAGRRPDVDDLGLDLARVRVEPGGIVVNAALRTANRRIHAIGDVIDGPRHAHAAARQGELVTRNALFGLPVRAHAAPLPRVTFTDPEIAHVGLTEPEARRRYKTRFKVLRSGFARNERAQALREAEGLVKMLVHRNGQILGVSIVGPQAGELIALFSLVIANRLKVASLDKLIAPYPTLSEIGRRLALDAAADARTSPWIARLLALNRLLP